MSEPVVIRCYDDLIEAFRVRVAELGITMETLDALSGLQPGYCAKLLGPARIKTLGVLSFDLLMESLALQFAPQTDMEKARKLEARWEGRERPQAVVPTRLSKRAQQRYEPIIIAEKNRRIGALGGKARAAKLSIRRLSQIGRKAARARWKKRS